DFTLNSNGDLVTMDGQTVQGDGGAINVNVPGATISTSGDVIANKQRISTLQVARFENPQALERVGNSRFCLPTTGAAPTTVEADVIPESIEMANVSAISSMVDLISANRAFEMYTRTAQSIDQLNQTAIQQVGRPRG